MATTPNNMAIGKVSKCRYFANIYPTKKNAPISFDQIILIRLAKPTAAIMLLVALKPLNNQSGNFENTICKPSMPKAILKNMMM